jgi:DNA-binding transcriptional MerR regulator
MTPLESKYPDKLYFKIGEVSEIAGVPPSVLRFWQTEFPRINPKRTPSGQRLYRRNDVELILKIKTLLYEKKFTIQGARQRLKTGGQKKAPVKPMTLNEIRTELIGIRDILNP